MTLPQQFSTSNTKSHDFVHDYIYDPFSLMGSTANTYHGRESTETAKVEIQSKTNYKGTLNNTFTWLGSGDYWSRCPL